MGDQVQTVSGWSLKVGDRLVFENSPPCEIVRLRRQHGRIDAWIVHPANSTSPEGAVAHLNWPAAADYPVVAVA